MKIVFSFFSFGASAKMMMVLNGDDVRFKYFFTKSPSDNGRSNPAIRICWMRGPTLIFYLKI